MQKNTDELFDRAPRGGAVVVTSVRDGVTLPCHGCTTPITIAIDGDALCPECADGGWRRAIQQRQAWLNTEFNAAFSKYEQALRLATDDIADKITRATTDLQRAERAYEEANRAAYRNRTNEEIMDRIRQHKETIEKIKRRIEATSKAHPAFLRVWGAYTTWQAAYAQLAKKERELRQDQLICEAVQP